MCLTVVPSWIPKFDRGVTFRASKLFIPLRKAPGLLAALSKSNIVFDAMALLMLSMFSSSVMASGVSPLPRENPES